MKIVSLVSCAVGLYLLSSVSQASPVSKLQGRDISSDKVVVG
jgi:hypothetical protein